MKVLTGASVWVLCLIQALPGASALSYDSAYRRSVCGIWGYLCAEAQAGRLWSRSESCGKIICIMG